MLNQQPAKQNLTQMTENNQVNNSFIDIKERNNDSVKKLF
jgi:hypothetical protein